MKREKSMLTYYGELISPGPYEMCSYTSLKDAKS